MRISAILLAVILFAACNQGEKKAEDHSQHGETAAATDTAMQAAPEITASTYFGVVPCADCEGIETTLTLKSDYRYQLHTIYQGRKSAGPGSNEISSEGTWMLHGADTIHLRDVKDGPSMYIRTDSSLVQLDMKGNRIEGKLAAKYILKKNG
jgi:uncharacterized lipoprotein NlpE involved in copper resistance